MEKDAVAGPLSILAVIVLYKISPENSTSFLSLLRSRSKTEDGLLKLDILVYDNSPGAVARELPYPGVTYIASASNAGLPSAYNYAARIASERGAEWLLTLDQDTVLPEDFCTLLVRNIVNDAGPDVGAVVPMIVAEGRVLSPIWMVGGYLERAVPSGFQGRTSREVLAFNSGATIRVAVIKEVGGYDPRFWLDFSDIQFFHQLSKIGKAVYVAGDLRLQHQFAMLTTKASPARYQNLLEAQSAFHDLALDSVAGALLTARLAVRYLKRLIFKEPQEFQRITFEMLRARLLHGRRKRLEAWTRKQEQRP